MKTKFLLAFALLALASCGGSGEKDFFTGSGDVGAVKIPGSVSFDPVTGTYTLTGAGTNMWMTSDEFFMTWREVTGDFSLSADIAFEGQGVNAHRKIGLIIRDGLAGDAVYADAAVHGDGLTSLQYRPSKGSETLEIVALPSGSTIPGDITLERHGDRIIIKTADSTAVGEITLGLPETCYVGLFICSHEADVSETGYFSNVKFSGLAE